MRFERNLIVHAPNGEITHMEMFARAGVKLTTSGRSEFWGGMWVELRST